MNFFLRRENAFLNIAHRGGAGLCPENTLYAFRSGLSAGAAAIEGDLHASRDGVIVFSHDATVNRCTEGQGYIKELTYKELRALDAGYRFTPDDGAGFPYRGKGLTIPSLEEAFNDPVLDRIPMVLEIKQETPSIIDAVLGLIEKYDMEDRLVIGSFSRLVLDEFREKARHRNMKMVTSLAEEEVMIFYLTPLEAMFPDGGYQAPAEILQVPVTHDIDGREVQVVDDLFMAKARHQGLKVQTWTVNEPAQMGWLMEQMKVDGIITDYPDLLARLNQGPAQEK